LAALPGEAVGPEQECVAGAPSLPRNILIIEDNTDSRESLARLLRMKGHSVVVAADGREGLDVAVRDRPDVALVDIGLPDVDGYRLASQLRSQLGPSVFLAALTGHGQPEDRERALGAGFDAHVTKPVELDVLEELFVQSLQGRPSSPR
jgi:CheY-like chemotaxis protein